MDIHTATEVAYKNGYARAMKELRESTTWTKVDEEHYKCNKCNSVNNKPSNFCPNCGRGVDY